MSDLERENPMTEPTKPASGSDPKTNEKEARELIRVQQEDANGCVLATLAMLTGDTYSQVKAAFIGHDFSKTGCCSEFEGCNYLRDRGFVYQKMYQHNGLTKTDRTKWPILWADSPLLVGYMAQVALGNNIHAVVVRPDGSVLDPWRDGEYRLADYVQCNHLIAVFDIRESRIASFASSREAESATCGGHENSVGGCGKLIPLQDAYRCSDCEQYFHRDCLRTHCETSSYITALRANKEVIDGWKREVAESSKLMKETFRTFWEYAYAFSQGFGVPHSGWNIGGFIGALMTSWNNGEPLGPPEHSAECGCRNCPSKEMRDEIVARYRRT